MSLFRKAGRTFEKTKRSILADGEPAFRCQSCGERVPTDEEPCPECGADDIEQVE